MTFEEIEAAIAPHGLILMGGLHPSDSLYGQTIVLLGTGENFWPCFTTAAEYLDGQADPVDRWSVRVIGQLATKLNATCSFPSDGPPYPPFIQWALQSGRAFTSPSKMLVHDQVGMLISYRGTLHFDTKLDIPAPPLIHSPCDSCAAKPCLTSCPVNAMVDGGPYELAVCHDYLDTADGTECLSRGCLARRACPLSDGAKRLFDQTAHHMRYFHAR